MVLTAPTGTSVRLAARVVLAVGLLTVAVVSLVPADRVPGAASVSDKVAHLCAYAVLGALAVASQSRRRLTATFGALLGFGLLLEVLQATTGYRSFEVTDLLADGVGIAMGMGVVALLRVPAPADRVGRPPRP